MSKKCSGCKETKPLEAFSKNKRMPDGLQYTCRTCQSAYYAKNRTRKIAMARPARLRREYGMSVDDYNDMFAAQGGACAICKTHQNELTQRLYVDHCHETERVRGLLCHKCNTLLGQAKDSVAILRYAMGYLLKSYRLQKLAATK